MTLSQEAPFKCCTVFKFDFSALRREVADALKEDSLAKLKNDEKLRLAHSPITYRGFQDLVSTVGLKPFNK